MNYLEFVSELSKIRPSATFLNLQNYQNEAGEVADFNIIFHISYESALKKSILILQTLVPENDLQAQAKDECLNSFQKSLSSMKETPLEEKEDAYQHFQDESGQYIKGVKLHLESKTLHLYGFVNNKVVKTAGSYKKVNSAPLTLEKNKIRKFCPVSKFRQFKMLSSQVESISVQGMHLLPPQF